MFKRLVERLTFFFVLHFPDRHRDGNPSSKKVFRLIVLHNGNIQNSYTSRKSFFENTGVGSSDIPDVVYVFGFLFILILCGSYYYFTYICIRN